MERYRSFSRVLTEQFGGPVRKISLDAGFSCPHRKGSEGGCTYCDAWGSGTGASRQGRSISDQIAAAISREAAARKPAGAFLAYFQAHTNTFAPVPTLRSRFEEALTDPRVVGLSIGTRPDCLPEPVLDLLDELNRRTCLWVELGLQSAHDETLRRVNRGHTVAQFADAVERCHARGIRVCAHVIFGLPGETREMMHDTARFLASLGIDGVKFHSLYLVPGTQMEREYRSVPFPLLSQQEYAEIVADALERLPPETVIQRLTGDPPRTIPAEPPWTRDKVGTLALIRRELARRDSFQGALYRG
ncbi:MAG TPA: TIGR01212 family radical SAM protein [Candidatus Latescibacteria bacterium]|mgnify:CR=1 FL=1|nr:TIGR01212 family radical SAM protein [Candidatus Latescibacterota bacterium]